MFNKILKFFNKIGREDGFDKGTNYFKTHLDFVREKNLYPAIYAIDGSSSSPEIIINGKKFLTFSSNNYLGLAGDSRIEQAVIRGVEKYGVGSGSTRLLSGTLDIQLEFEQKLIKFSAAKINFNKKIISRYGNSQGIDDLINEVIESVRKKSNMELEKENILITNGATNAIFY